VAYLLTQTVHVASDDGAGGPPSAERMFLLGKFGGFLLHNAQHNGERAKNDVCATLNGTDWEAVLLPQNGTMPWGARAWARCMVWDGGGGGATGTGPAEAA